MTVRFTWDAAKARSNWTKHRVSFGEAATAFADPLALYLQDEARPERGILIGQSDAARLLFAVFVEIVDDEIRLVSARRASAHERKRYEEGV